MQAEAVAERLKYYGTVPLDRVDVAGKHCLSIDLRLETGGPGPDETQIVNPGHSFRLSVFAPSDGEHPTAEVRFMLEGREVSLVGHLTGRPGVTEITPDHIAASIVDDAYLSQLRQWLGV